MVNTDIAQLQYNNLRLNSQLTNLKNGNLSDAEALKLKEACQDFESLFVKQMLNAMRKTVNKNVLLDGGMAEDVFEDMLYDKYADSIASSANLGISKMLYKELSKTSLTKI